MVYHSLQFGQKKTRFHFLRCQKWGIHLSLALFDGSYTSYRVHKCDIQMGYSKYASCIMCSWTTITKLGKKKKKKKQIYVLSRKMDNIVGLKPNFCYQNRLFTWKINVLWQIFPFWTHLDENPLHRVRSNRPWNSPFVTIVTLTWRSESVVWSSFE